MPFELDRDQHREAWAAVDFPERRRIIKAVNRGEALSSRADARLAVGVATNQMRFWRWAWILGPMGALFQVNRGALQVVVNAVVATVVLGGLSYWFYRRADRARTANIEVATTGRAGPKAGTTRDAKAGAKGGGKRGAERRAEAAEAGSTSEPDTPTRPRTPPGPTEKFSEFRPDPNTSRAKAKRRKKRR